MGGAEPESAEVDRLPGWVTLLLAPNPGPMTLNGTNTWILRSPGSGRAAVIDPGPMDEGHLRRIAGHDGIECIMITHGHHDHVEGAARLAELLGGVPVRAAAPAHCTGGAPFRPGEPVDLDGLVLRVLPTPGHTGDSVSFLAECGDDRAVFTGDTMLGRGTTVVAAPDGDLGAYLSSLELLQSYPAVMMLPGHGPARGDTAERARFYLNHRRERLAQVAAAMAAGAETPAAVVDLVYPDLDQALRFAAEWSAAAQIDHLRRKAKP